MLLRPLLPRRRRHPAHRGTTRPRLLRRLAIAHCLRGRCRRSLPPRGRRNELRRAAPRHLLSLGKVGVVICGLPRRCRARRRHACGCRTRRGRDRRLRPRWRTPAAAEATAARLATSTPRAARLLARVERRSRGGPREAAHEEHLVRARSTWLEPREAEHEDALPRRRLGGAAKVGRGLPLAVRRRKVLEQLVAEPWVGHLDRQRLVRDQQRRRRPLQLVVLEVRHVSAHEHE